MFSYRIDENLKLVLPQLRHAEEITAAVRENLDELKLWMPWATNDYSIDSSREFIKGNLTELSERGSFSAYIDFNEKLAGCIGFHNLDTNNKSAHIGYWLTKEARGKGLMTRCCGVLIEYLFDDLELNRVQINCSVKNVKSRAIPERLGFKLEGVHRRAEFLNNEFRDLAVYAMLKEERESI